MLSNIEEIINRLKQETNYITDIIYRLKIIKKKKIYIIYNEPLVSSDRISDFIIRSLTNLDKKKINPKNILKVIENDISNFKVTLIDNYDDLCLYIHRGFTVILIDGEEQGLILETKGNIKRSIATPIAENTLRGARDAFVEDYQTNIGLIKKRIKSNNLWMNNASLGKYTKTQIGILAINGVVKNDLFKKVCKRLKKINIDGVINSDIIKNLIEQENKSPFPTVITTERPDIVCQALLNGKVVIIVDNSPYALIIPGFLNDFFKTTEDIYGKSINVSFTRILKCLAFIIALLCPAIYISLITYNQEMIPTELLVNFATQRDGVPFPAFFEATIMIISFEILRESDLRVPSFSGSALSIVGALILGEAAVNAGIVSPIMIIIIAITAISSLPFTEPDLINSLRWYRLFFMIGASFLGIVGVVAAFIYFLIKLSSLETFGKPYLMPYVPTSIIGLKNSFIKFPVKKQTNRLPYLSNNNIKQRGEQNENI
ncbi:MAG: spore germination protein [Bacilli bacterium]